MARRLIVATVLVGAVSVGCADDPTLDPASVEVGLAETLFPSDPGIVTAISCPEPDIELIAQALVCTASLHGRPITIEVEIAEDGASTAAVREQLLDLAGVADQLAVQISADIGVGTDVSCPGLFVVDEPGVEFTCTATRDGRPLTFRGAIVDDAGTWTVTAVP